MPWKHIFSLALFAGLLLASGCDDYLDINENPNVATSPPLDGLLATASSNTGLNQFRVSNGFTAFYVQYLASPNEGNTLDTYLETDNSGTWGSIYNTMTDLYDLIRFGEERGATAHVGVGKALMAMNVGLVVDNWGSAPYSDAFTGETLRPTYDSGEALYTTIFNLLDEAERALSDVGDSPAIDPDSDFVHGGDLAAWQKTISALRARYLNHLSETGDYSASDVLAAVAAAYESAADNAAVSNFQLRNPWAQVAINNDNLLLGGWLSEQFVDALNGTTFGTFDPRLPVLTDTTINGNYRGTPNGGGRIGDGTVPEESYLVDDGAKSSPESPLDIITYAELKFIEAEAALASGADDRALTAFREGVTSDIVEVLTFVGTDPAAAEQAAADYLTAAYPDLSASTLTEDMIFREKYVALFLSPETWVDARRYNFQYADFDLPLNAAINEFPVRVQYPATETDRNAANTPIVTLTDPIFWDQ
jgi:hypothetical protein